jgi:adenylyltransferase/sulfurtransferase
VLDVRGDGEAAIVKLDFVDRIYKHDEILKIQDELPKDRDILVHCKMGGRSAKAAAALSKAGFTRLTNLEGGITAWANEIDTSLPTY